jgi:hypothetical protein
MTNSLPLTSVDGLPRTDVDKGEALNTRNIVGIVVLLIVLYLVLHFLFHVI